MSNTERREVRLKDGRILHVESGLAVDHLMVGVTIVDRGDYVLCKKRHDEPKVYYAEEGREPVPAECVPTKEVKKDA